MWVNLGSGCRALSYKKGQGVTLCQAGSPGMSERAQDNVDVVASCSHARASSVFFVETSENAATSHPTDSPGPLMSASDELRAQPSHASTAGSLRKRRLSRMPRRPYACRESPEVSQERVHNDVLLSRQNSLFPSLSRKFTKAVFPGKPHGCYASVPTSALSPVSVGTLEESPVSSLLPSENKLGSA